MPRKKFLIPSLFLLLIPVAVIANVLAQNDTIVFDEPVSGSLGQTDTNRWTFEAHRDDVVEITLDRQSGDLAPRIALLDQNNKLQAQIQGSEDTPTTSLLLRIPRFGTYTIQLQAADDTSGDYELGITLTEAGLRAYEQGAVTYGQTVTQRISDAIPYNFWTFSGKAGQVIDLKMTTTDGDLEPVMTLTSPGGDVIARVSSTPDNREARLLAFRLPGDGTYRISARREGGNLGIDGETTGAYNLELTLRNGSEATANTYTIGETAIGRLTEESPIVRYDLPRTGTFAATIELSSRDCLVDLAVMNQGTVLLDRYTAASPFQQILTIPNVSDPILEISTADCALREDIDFTLSLDAINVDLPIRTLPNSEVAYSDGNAELERWYIQGNEGDLIQFKIQRDQAEVSALLRIVGPDLITRYTENLYDNNTSTLLLDKEGIYYIQISPGNTPYTLQWNLVGDNGIPFSMQTPIFEEVMNVSETGVWQFEAKGDAQFTLVVQNPLGEVIGTERSTFLNSARIDAITLDRIGRYQLQVFGNVPPESIARSQLTGAMISLGETVKGSLEADHNTNTWILPVQANNELTVTLDVLNGNPSLPMLAVLSETGSKVEPTLTRADDGSSIQLIGIEPLSDQYYHVLVSSNPANGRIDYRLSVNALDGATTVPTSLTVTSPITEGFAEPVVQNAPDYLVPAFNPAVFDSAERISLPNQLRAEIAPNEIRKVWSLNIVRGQLLSVTAVNIEDGNAPGITLLDSNRNVILSHWEHNEASNQLLYRTPEATQYYLAITGDRDGGRFLVTIDTLPGLDETVPVVRDETPLALNSPYVTDMDEVGEVDTYTFWANSGTALQITANSLFGDLVPNLQVFSPSGVMIAEVEYENEMARLERVAIPQSGVYTLRVTANQRDGSTSYSRYQLVLNVLAGQEVNRGGRLEGEGIGLLGVGTPENTWLFHAESGESVSLNVEPISTTGPTPIIVSLTDSDGAPFYQKSTQLSVNAVSINDITLPRTGLYRVIVRGGNSAIGSYRIQLTRNYAITNSGDHAITYSDTQSGLLTQEKPLDRWMLAGNAGDIISVSASPLLGDLSRIGFQLENAQGDILRIGADRENGAGAYEDNIMLPETDIYYVMVGSTDVNFAGNLVYNLTVQRQNRTNARSWGSEVDFGQIYTGTLYADDNADIWVLDIQRPATINITVVGDSVLAPTFDVVAYNAPLIDGQPQPLLTRTGTIDNPARLVNTLLPESGAYAIIVRGIDGATGSYTILVESVPETIPARRILQDDLNYEDSIRGDEIKKWVFNGRQGDLINLTINVPRRSSLVPEMRIRDEYGTLLLSEQNFDGVTLAVKDYVLPSTGSYTVEIVPTRTSISTSTYTLTFDQRENPFTPTIETFAYGEAGINEFNADNTSDQWTFEGQAGDVIHITGARTNGYFDPVLTLSSPSGQVIAQADDSPDSLDPEILQVLPETGTYTVEIGTYAGLVPDGDLNNYRLDLELVYRPATIPPLNDFTINYGDAITDTLDPITEETNEFTYWYFNGKVGDVVDIALQFPTDDSPLRLFLADGAGNIYQQGERNRDRATIRGFTLPSDGTYTITIQRSLDSQARVYYPYSLSLSLREGEPDSLVEGGFLTKGEINGASFETSPTHVWLYSGQAGEIINLDLIKLTGQSSPSLIMLSPNNRTLLDESPNGDLYNIPFTLPTDGLYQIFVINKDFDPFLSYRILITGEQSIPLAGRLQPNVTDFGNLTINQNQEVWFIEGTAGQPIFARAESIHENLSLHLQLETPDGVIIAASQIEVESGQAVLEPVILPEDGQYRLIVSQRDEVSGTYRIRISDQRMIPQAITAEQLSEDVPVQGFVDGVTEQYYLFFGKPNVPLSIGAVIDDGTQAPQLEVLDRTGELVTANLGAIENLELPADGYYLLRVTGASPVSYTISYHERPLAGTQTATVQRRTNLQGNLSNNQPSNLWTFNGTAGETIAIYITDFSQQSRSDVVLFDPRGIPVIAAIEPPNTTEFVLPAVFISQDGIYTLRVGSWLGNINPSGNQYILRLEPAAEDAGLGSDGGNIVVLGQSVQGGLSGNDTSDTWTFYGVAGAHADIQLRNTLNNQVLSLTLHAPNGEMVNLEDYTVVRTRSLQITDLPLEQAGKYELIVELADGIDITAYSLSVSTQAPDIEIFLSRAQSLQIGDTVIGNTADIPAWAFYAPTGSSVEINVTPAMPVTLVDAEGSPIRHSEIGVIDPVILLENGFYSIILNADGEIAPTDYTLTLTPAQFQTTWRWTLGLGNTDRVALSTGAPLHEWQLTNHGTGDYQIIIKPTSNGWQANAFILDNENNTVAISENHPDGSTSLDIRLEEEKTYRVMVSGDGAGGSYDIAFEVSQNTRTPEMIEGGQTVTGRISSIDTADEWLLDTNEGTLLNLQAVRTEGDFQMIVRVYAPGNLFLQQFEMNEEGVIEEEGIILPVAGRYIIQVTRLNEATSDAEGLYELTINYPDNP